MTRVTALGWEPILAPHAGGRNGYLSGTDAERLADLNGALRSGENDAIWCLRGGYGVMRIIEAVDWGALRLRPRPLIGFSDNTVLHLAAWHAGVVTFHGPHPGADELSPFSLSQLRGVLTRGDPLGRLPAPPAWKDPVVLRGGRAEGPLVGGNLSLVAGTLGTPYALPADGAILFLEEVGEHVYRVDRLLSQLLLAGVFRRVAGVAIGAFSDTPDEGVPGLPSPLEVIRDRLEALRVPVLAGLPFGHIPETWTLPVGTRARLDADTGELQLLEPHAV